MTTSTAVAAATTTWTVPMTNLPNTSTGYNFYIWGMTSAAAAATINVTDPNGNVWTLSTANMIKGQAFNLPNPAGGNQPYGWTWSGTPNASQYTFDISISSTATGTNQGISLVEASNSDEAVMAVVLYNDPNSSDEDYNDVVLNIAFYPNEPQGA